MLALALFSRPGAAADEARSIVVLRGAPADAAPWPEGTQAVIAELLAAGYAVRVREMSASTARGLEGELETARIEARAAGAVSVLRQGEMGFALLQTRAQGFARLQADAATTEGTVAESRLALRVVELLREVDIPEPPAAAPERPPVLAPVRSAPRPARPAHGNQIWLGGGTVFASDVAGPLPWVALAGGFTLLRPVAVEPTVGAAFASGHARTAAGKLDLRAQQVAIYLMFDPFVDRDLGIALGLGGGGIWMQETASPNTGFVARDDSTSVGLIGARVRAFARTGKASFAVGVEPGLLLPAVSVHTGGAEVLDIGRPWVALTLSVGVSL